MMSNSRYVPAVTMIAFITSIFISISGLALGKEVIVARVKGKGIELSELNKATAPYRAKYEEQGIDFGSTSGKVALQRLQLQVLQQMVAVELLEAGVRRAKISVSDDVVETEYKKIVGKQKGGETAYIKEMSRIGWTKDDIMNDIKSNLLIEKFIEKSIAKGKNGDEVDTAVSEWLQEQAKSDVEILFKVNAPSQGDALKTAEKAGLDYYRERYGVKAIPGVQAKATNYGCHTQVDIIKDGKIVKSLGYGGGDVYEID